MRSGFFLNKTEPVNHQPQTMFSCLQCELRVCPRDFRYVGEKNEINNMNNNNIEEIKKNHVKNSKKIYFMGVSGLVNVLLAQYI